MSAPLRVLVADDQDIVRAGLVTIIDSQADLTVVGEAADGAAALVLAGELRPDVVVTDVRMPLLDGIELTRALAGAGVAEPLTVLVVTTFNLDEYVFQSLRAGAAGFLLKSARPRELLDAIRTVAAGEALVSPTVTRALVGQFGARLREPRQSMPGPASSALSPRENEVLALVARGLSNAEIAEELVISRETVKTFVSRILTKLDLRDRVQAVIYAYRTGLVSGDD